MGLPQSVSPVQPIPKFLLNFSIEYKKHGK